MMEQMSSWLSSGVAVSRLVFLLRQILPEGSLRGIGEFTGGLVLLAALLQPLGDSRMLSLLEQTAGSFMLVFAIVALTGVLFFFMILIVLAAGGSTF